MVYQEALCSCLSLHKGEGRVRVHPLWTEDCQPLTSDPLPFEEGEADNSVRTN